LKSPADGDLSCRVFSAKQEIYKAYGDHLQFVTPSQWLKDQALKSGALTSQLRDSIRVVPNPIDTDYFYPAESDVLLASSDRCGDDTGQYESDEGLIHGDHKVGDKQFRLMFAAANLGNAAKGFAEFRTLCNSLVAKGYTNIEALVVGDNRIGDLGLNCTHTALGFIADAQKMRDAYWKADVYVTTSHEENLPTTIMESLSCGVPVAAFSVGGIPEMVDVHESSKTGWLAPKLDVEALVKQIAAYIDLSPEDRSVIQSNCRETALNRYSAMSISKVYAAIYRA
jgi:glycosyltransferase involved in cell wall biosynthesis